MLNSRDDKGTNISQSLNLLVNSDGSLSPFVLPGADERTAWSVDAWFNLGPFDLIGEYLQEKVDGRTVTGVPPGFADFTTNGFYVTGAYFLIPKKLQAAVRWEQFKPGTKGQRWYSLYYRRPQLLHPRRRSQANGELHSHLVGFPASESAVRR